MRLPACCLRPYPDARWNAWRNVPADELDPGRYWVCVQSVELASGKARRVLDGHPSTQPERGVVVETDGRPLRYPDGRKVRFAAGAARGLSL